SLSEDVYPNLRERESVIKAELQREESRFLETLERGEKLLAEIMAKPETQKTKQISGEDAFKLYDTYGFPLELTQEIAEENGLTVDVSMFEKEMKLAQERSQSAHETIDLTAEGGVKLNVDKTEFLGYTDLTSSAQVMALVAEGEQVESAEAGTQVQVVLDQTPFYAESGGQIGDRGYLSGDNVVVRIEDVQKQNNIFVHFGRVERGTLQLGITVNAQIDAACRRRAQANHTATHLLQAALRSLVDSSISQAGSLVSFDRLRFDFNCPRGLKPEEVEQVEAQVNSWIAEAHPATVAEMPLDEAKAKGAVAMFGEKYSDVVRVVDYPGVSMELCGGTHVNNTAEIGVFKIISEAGISSGVRRIEAVAGLAVLDYLNVRDTVVKELSDRFKAKPEELSERVSNLQQELKESQKQLEALKGELAVAKSDQLLGNADTVGEFQILVAEMPGIDAEALKTAAERLQQKLGESAVVLGAASGEKVSLVAAFSKSVNGKGFQAGKFIGGIAKMCGGGGGGRPNLAQAGGRDPSKLKEALESAREQLVDGLK
ncbi:MAG: alanine--tRNA ligase, partial [Okeania sp. SIO3C4]|nr:alanine--tRNA ligase [Okeania sp. SIO3C4]